MSIDGLSLPHFALVVTVILLGVITAGVVYSNFGVWKAGVDCQYSKQPLKDKVDSCEPHRTLVFCAVPTISPDTTGFRPQSKGVEYNVSGK